MPRRGDPERIYQAQRAGVFMRLVSAHPTGLSHLESGFPTPTASYQVFLVIDASAIPNCDSLRILMAADLQTNAAGNGTTPADFVFRPGGIPPCLRNASFPISWEVEQGGTVTHQSDVIAVTLD